MFGNGSETSLLERLLSASVLRAKVIAANVANQNTPGYRRREVHFEDLLREALARGASDLDRIRPEVVTDALSPMRADGNNVDIEAEMSALRENRLLYETYSALLEGHFQMLRMAISQGT